jgi:hypothetical protein
LSNKELSNIPTFPNPSFPKLLRFYFNNSEFRIFYLSDFSKYSFYHKNLYDVDRTWRINDDKITCHLNVKPETTCCRKQENQDNDKFPIGSLHYLKTKKNLKFRWASLYFNAMFLNRISRNFKQRNENSQIYNAVYCVK